MCLFSEAGSLRLKSRARQIRHSVANSLPPLGIFSKGAVLSGRNDAEIAPATRYTLWRNTASIIKDLI